MITITIFSVIIVCHSLCPLILLLILYFIFPLIFFLAQYFIRRMHFYILWSFCLFPPHSLYYLSNVSRYTIFYALCPLLSLKPFFSVSAGAVFSCAIVSLSLSFSGVLRGTARKRMPHSASSFSQCAPRLIPASDLRIVHPIARLFPRGSHWYQDPDIRITGVPRGLLLPSLHGGRGSNGRPLVAVGLEALFLCLYPDIFISRIGEQVGREKETKKERFI